MRRFLALIALVCMFATDSVLAYSLTDNDNALLSKVYTKLDALSQQKRDKVISQLETMVPTIKNDRIHELVIALIVKYDPNSAYAIMSTLQSSNKTDTGYTGQNENVDSGSTIKLNQPFVLWNIEYTILSIKTFNKVWYQDEFSNYSYPKNGEYMMVDFSYKNVATDGGQHMAWAMKIIDWETMYEKDIDWCVYGKTQINWDKDMTSNWIGFLPSWVRKEVFVSFDVAASVVKNWVFYIEWDYSAGKLQTIKIPLKNLQ